ncbi:hypothetical protein Ddc_18114 [Ditylenchus destructor]|nr:hypothetical protein Ddc_18114 [Ditylenchus destructor]
MAIILFVQLCVTAILPCLSLTVVSSTTEIMTTYHLNSTETTLKECPENQLCFKNDTMHACCLPLLSVFKDREYNNQRTITMVQERCGLYGNATDCKLHCSWWSMICKDVSGNRVPLRRTMSVAHVQNLPLFDTPAPQTRGILGVLAKETFQSPLGSGRVIHQSLPLGETKRLVPVSPTKIDSSGIYGFRKIQDFDQGQLSSRRSDMGV